ncbi:MAG: protein kinase, partial [Terriglobia bacterium]
MINQTISHYRIVEKLGEGGMGVVYKAQDTQLGRWVALKILPAEMVQDEQRRRRFYDEARSASALNHPNIATIYEIAEADGTHFIAMEFVEGQTLRRQLSRGRLPLKRALDIAIQVAEGLNRAHARGIVHRDIKPENLMVTPEGLIKILDFGLAKRIEPALPGADAALTLATATEPGTVLGTVAYMSPEQAQGNPVDPRSDIFSFGAVLYELLTGEQPFQGDSSIDVLHAIVRTAPRPLAQFDPTLPLELNRIMEKAFAKDAEERYQGIKDLSIDLKRLKRDTESGVEAVAPVAARPAPRWWLAAAAGLAVVALVAGLYLFLSRRAEAPSQALTIKPLTSFVGLEWGVTWSPDASFVAYAHTAPGPMNIFVMATAGGEPIRLTSSPADDLTPRWSPDNRYLAFLSDRGTGTNVYLIPPLGGPERKLVETNIPWLQAAVAALSALGAVPWSPDASELLFSRLQPSAEIAVWKINLSTGEQTQLTRPPPGAADFYATWSFDGKRIAFTRNQGGKNSLWLMDAQEGPSASLGTSEPELLLDDEYQNMTPAWSPDGQRLVFISNRSGPRNLWEIEVGSRRLRQVTSGAGNYILPTISPTGRVAYAAYSH